MKAMGFKPSERHRGELSEDSEGNNNRDDATSDSQSVSETVYTESRYATSTHMKEDRQQLADKVRMARQLQRAKDKEAIEAAAETRRSKERKECTHTRIDDIDDDVLKTP